MSKLIFKLFHAYPVFLLLFLGTIFITGCWSITGKVVHLQNETAKNIEIYFCPRDDCGKIFEENIKSANSSVHCALYDLNLKNLITALSSKSKNADVKVVIDNSNNESQIKGDGVEADSNKQLMHNKFCVIDDYTVISGSFNPTFNDNFRNSNNVVVVYSKTLAGNYEGEFQELWNGVFGKGSNVKNPEMIVNGIRIENYFCPEDSCASRIVDLINGAESSIYFMAFSFTNEGIADALIKKNIEIRGIFDSSQSSGKYSQFKRMKEFGLNVIKDKNKYKMHHKVFIIDNQTVVTGSFNPTLSGDQKNDENLLIIHDREIAAKYFVEFDGLWN